MPEDSITYHAGIVNHCSIGIEIANIGWGWLYANTANEPTLSQRCNPQSICPQRANAAQPGNPPVWLCNCIRPGDQNRWIHLQNALGGYTDYQAFEDKQYTVLIYLLRHLCITHKIPRRFLGITTEEVFRRWAFSGDQPTRRRQKSSVFRFRGILHHRNVHENKPCPGVLHRNRLFRGIIDEWWLPIDPFGVPRSYYSGPFSNPAFQPGHHTQPSLFRWGAAGEDGAVEVEAHTYHDADIDAISESKSYYDFDHTELYYRSCETRNGGLFPVGANKIWHGGVHFFPEEDNPAVYAAASGVIVAARLTCNEETEQHPDFGSQRFVLIRHYVHMRTVQERGGRGERIDYGGVPTRVFSLYMHLGPVANTAAENDRNPPWFNSLHLRRRAENAGQDVGVDPGTGKGRVFCPDIEVSVGDVLGVAGSFGGRRCLHFEIFSHRNDEFTTGPWNNRQLRCDDSNDGNAVYDETVLDRFLTDIDGDGLDIIDVLRAAPSLRNAKTLHKSEWSLQTADALAPAISSEKRRTSLWRHIEKFTWWNEMLRAAGVGALATNGVSLENQMGADGIVWHYHPVAFMNHINSMILAENSTIDESGYTQTNVEIDEKLYITDFIDFQNNGWVPAAADNAQIRPYEIAAADYRFHFQRRHIACAVCRAGGVNPQQTRFSLALLSLLEQIRLHFNAQIDVSLSYLCPAHGIRVNSCCLNDRQRASAHAAGKAVDFAPSQRTDAECRRLFNSARHIAEQVFNPAALARGGTVSQDCLPEDCGGAVLTIHPAGASNKLHATPQQALTQAERNDFCIHLELSPLLVCLCVRFVSLNVLNDSDILGRGEWSLSGRINDRPHGPFRRSVAAGETVPFPPDWTTEVSYDPNAGETLVISIQGTEKDLFFDDKLGADQVSFDANSAPSPWGVGRHTLRSSTGHYTCIVEISNA